MRRNTLLPVLGLALALSGCGSPAGPAAVTGPALRAQLPKAIRSAGLLRIGSDLNYAPVDFKAQDGTPTGLDVDLAGALGGYLGLRVQFFDQPFEKLIPAVQSRQIDLAMSAVIDTRQRQTGADDNGRQVNAGVDFVDYFMTGTAILVRSGNPLGVTNLDNLCGHTVAMQRGTVQAEIAARQQAVCQRGGKPLKVDLFDTDDQALTEVASGTAVADLNDYPVAAYNTDPARGGDRFQVTGALLQPSPYGITVNKDDDALRDVLAKAMNQLIRNGTYDTILTRWNAHDGALLDASVDAGF
ncbi:ABC transporter substrate-binding protein [Kitasatospora nipponensis]|uniref:ABC transporter substrate-binding protein n=1 Tax=Kitasatospora nipponensis TaxID=258049 RepID=A0ABN1WTG5_9ACTN